LLAEHFLDECARRFHQPRKRLGPTTRTALESYSWPGNVRELENLIVRDYLMSDSPELVWSSESSPAPEEPLTSYAAAKAAAVADFDRRFLRELLTRAAGNVTRAAAEAGKERRALGRLVKKYGLRSHDFKP
jgi:DNA-binding NtrC family response regulator